MSLCPRSLGKYNWRFTPLKTPLLIHLTSSISAAKCKNFDCSLEKKISQKFCQDRSKESVVSFKIVDKLERFRRRKDVAFLKGSRVKNWWMKVMNFGWMNVNDVISSAETTTRRSPPNLRRWQTSVYLATPGRKCSVSLMSKFILFSFGHPNFFQISNF